MDTAPCEAKRQMYKGLANKNYDTKTHHRAWSEAVAIRMVISSHQQLRTFFAEQAEVFIGKPARCTYGAGLRYRAVRLHGAAGQKVISSWSLFQDKFCDASRIPRTGLSSWSGSIGR